MNKGADPGKLSRSAWHHRHHDSVQELTLNSQVTRRTGGGWAPELIRYDSDSPMSQWGVLKTPVPQAD